MLKLKKILADIGKSQSSLAEHCKVSTATISQLVNHNLWPKNEKIKQHLSHSITTFMMRNKGNIYQLFEVEPECSNTQAPDCKNNQSVEDINMLLPKQILSQSAKAHFSIITNPFGELQCDDDLWQSKDIRVVREHMYNTAKHGGITAITGESGAGKSCVRRSLLNRISKENSQIIVAQPYMLAAEDSEKKGKILKITHISDAILRVAAPLAKPKLSSDAKFLQLHDALLNVEKSGQRVCLLIDEAHRLSIPSLKHLKGLYELEPSGGYGSLISIILIGQPELKTKLDERNPDIRELVQRCDVVTLKPIAVAELEDFIDYRMGRINKKSADIIDQSGLTAMANCLQSGNGQSQLWPLLIGNFLIAAMNKAAHLGLDVINDDVVKEVATWRK